MNVFLINLGKNKERLRKCDNEFSRLGVPYERFDAIYGRELGVEYKKSVVSYLRRWFANGRFPWDGEIGCILSHYGVYELMEQRGLDYACIVEDDISLKDDFVKQLNVVESRLDPGRKEVYFLFCHVKGLEDTRDWVMEETNKACFAECYVITRRAAKAIMEVNSPIRAPIDAWGRWIRRAGVHAYYAFPVVASQDMSVEGYSSDICTGVVKKSTDFTFPYRVILKSLRLIGKIVDRLY